MVQGKEGEDMCIVQQARDRKKGWKSLLTEAHCLDSGLYPFSKATVLANEIIQMEQTNRSVKSLKMQPKCYLLHTQVQQDKVGS